MSDTSLSPPAKAGYTIIELSIVLLVIGLIVGGVLVGKHLIEVAQIRSTISQLQAYATAANTFVAKYNCLPGDCANAVNFGLGIAGGPGDNGDGNGSIFSCPHMLNAGWWSTNQEMVNFWYHLWRAGLIGEQLSGFPAVQPSAWDGLSPKTKVGSLTYINAVTIATQGTYACGYPGTGFREGFGNSFYLSAYRSDGNFDYSLSVAQSYAIDTKIDDGLPYTGNVMVGQLYSGPAVVTPPSVQGCTAADGSNAYDLQGNWDLHNGADTSGSTDKIECILGVTKAF
jgi:prepilin-type N-terminal cleavage/methylation domain-containing protein